MKFTGFDRIVFSIAAGLAYLGNRIGVGGEVEILSVTPGDGFSPGPTDPIRIEFGQAMDPASVQSRLAVRPEVQGKFNWTGNIMTFQHARPLMAGQVYNVSLLAGAQTSRGQQTQRPLNWSFHPRLPSVVILESDQRTLRVVSLGSTSENRELLFAPGTILDVTARPDGGQIAFSLLRSGVKAEIWLVDPSIGKQLETVDCGNGSCSSPLWSPDGKLLAFARGDPSPSRAVGLDRIWLYDLKAKKTAPVFQDNQVLGTRPIWSADSGSLAFLEPNSAGIHIVNLASREIFFIQEGFFGSAGSLSPDGKILAYTKIVSTNGQFIPQIWLAHLGPSLTYTPLMKDAGGFSDSYPA